MTAVTYRAARVLAGPDLSPDERSSVVVEGGRVVAVGDVAGEVTDAGALTLLPGFIDAHVHLLFYPPLEVLRGGVTTVRDLGWPADEIFGIVERSRAPDFEGPRVIAVGPMLTAPGGYPTHAAWAPRGTGAEVADDRRAEELVSQLADRGACAIKVALNPPVGPTFEREVLAAVTAAAHRRDLRVTAHVHGLEELEKAIACGVDELAHMLMSSEELPPDVIREMVERDVVVVPTLSVRFGDDREVAVGNVARFVEAGGKVVYGTDLGNEGPRPGIDPREIEALADAGMPPADIVRSATSVAAGYLGVEGGTIEEGRSADLIGTEGDPTADLGALQRVRLVVRGGVRVA